MGSFSTQYVSDEFKSRLPRGNKLAKSLRGLGTETVPRTWNTDTQAYQKIKLKKDRKSMSEQRAYFVNINIA